MVLSDDVTGLLLVITAGVALVLLVVVVVLLVKFVRLQQAYASTIDSTRREDLLTAVARLADDLAATRADVGTVNDNTAMLRDLLKQTMSRSAVVRYDAFEDMGGALSFSAALLDEHGDGVVISAINGRSETRCYAKSVRGLASEFNLTDEERTAIGEAASGRGVDREVTRRKRRG